MTLHTIARSLSPAESHAIMHAESRDGEAFFMDTARYKADVFDAMHAKGLLFITMRGVMLTDTAMAVRAIIEEEGI